MKRFVCSGLVALWAVLLAIPASAILRPEDATCRRGLMLAERRLTFHLVRQMGQCHLQRARGRLRSDVDCNDPANVPYPRTIERVARSVAQLAKSQCRQAGTPASLGFTTCPAPCGSATPLTSYARDVAPCIVCQSRSEASGIMAAILPEPPVTGPHTRETDCVEAVTTGVRKHVSKVLENLRYCQYLRDRGRLPATPSCRDDDVLGHVARSRSALQYYLARCKNGSRARVLACGTGDVQSGAACIEAAVDTGVEGLFDTVYPR